MSVSIFYQPGDLAKLHALGIEFEEIGPAPEHQACVIVPFHPEPVDPVKTIEALDDGTFKVCDPTMIQAVVPGTVDDLVRRLIELGTPESTTFAKDVALTAEEWT